MICDIREQRVDVNSQPEWTPFLGGRQPLGVHWCRRWYMALIWLGVLLVFGGVLLIPLQPIPGEAD